MNANIPNSNKKRVVIIGGGFGGLKLAQEIVGANYQVVLIDRNNYHQFQPLFYQVATAGLEPNSIVFPFRKIFQNEKEFYFRLGDVLSIQPSKNEIETTVGIISYDYLVIATGADTNFFGNKNLEEKAIPMKSVAEALSLRNTIFQRFEDALTTSTEEDLLMDMHIVVVGGGPTGVEVAGTLAEMKNYILPKDYPEMDFSKMKIYLVEGSPRVLNAMSEISSTKAKDYLEKLGVNVIVNTVVEEYDGTCVHLKDGQTILTKTLIWAAGIIGNRIKGLPESSNAPGGRILVNEFNQVLESENIFAIGDVASIVSIEYPRGHPQMAQPAIQQGKNLSKNLKNLLKNKPLIPFHYKNLGSMATIGKNKAVVELPKYKFQGFFAWLVWMVVHLRSIIGVKNKLLVLINWVWNYLTYNLSLRLIIRHKNKI